jgi:hypothetical protein
MSLNDLAGLATSGATGWSADILVGLSAKREPGFKFDRVG